MDYKLTFRMRTDRTDKEGKAQVFADVYWALGRRGSGYERLNGLRTGISCAPANWMPERVKQAIAANKRPPSLDRLIYTAEKGALGLNLRLERIRSAVSAVFTICEGENRFPDTQEVRDAVAGATGLDLPVAKKAKAVAPAEFTPTVTSSMVELLEHWKYQNKGVLAKKTLVRYESVPVWVGAFQPGGILVTDIDRGWLARYVNFLYENDLHDATVQNHYKWFREAFRLVGLPVPRFLMRVKFRNGKRPVLLPAELRAVMHVVLDKEPELEHERDVFVFQTLMLLRDTDMQKLRPHHAVPLELPGNKTVLSLTLYQNKTGEPVHLVMPPEAERIWRRYEGALPIMIQKTRNLRIKEVGTRARLNRQVIVTKFAGVERTESTVELRKAISTHTARHTGAAMITKGSGGNDRDLKEIALGHVNDTYGSSDVYLYGPKILAAWESALG